jgi:hypothetical protein
MTRTATFLLAATLTAVPLTLFAQTQSPDQQQENKPDTKPQDSHGDRGEPHNGQSPDIQQQKNSGHKPYKKKQNNARQAHGTPKPKSDTATSH